MLQLVVTDPFEKFKKTINIGNKEYSYFDLPKFGVEYGNIQVYILF